MSSTLDLDQTTLVAAVIQNPKTGTYGWTIRNLPVPGAINTGQGGYQSAKAATAALAVALIGHGVAVDKVHTLPAPTAPGGAA